MYRRTDSSDKSPWPGVFGDLWSHIHLSLPSDRLFFTGTFSSAFLLKLNLCCSGGSSHSAQAETRLDLPSALPDIPSTFLCASWHCALCRPHTLAQLISDCFFFYTSFIGMWSEWWPHHSEKMPWESKVMLHCCNAATLFYLWLFVNMVEG